MVSEPRRNEMPALEHKLADPNTPFHEKLRILCGYVENGSDTAVKVYQDDATKEWIVRVGINDTRTYHSHSFENVFALAFEDPRNNPF
ncbi:hypothetical protein EVC27_007 [Rhizobium phage RHph_I1_6]|uniref:Uncharacterized protein n=1 Tax=Rhizobium phage RHph_I1_6 TaxID=2509728 RepID=A0A7S5RFG3_9CAUD|nr:hypothetical protein PP745_gp007 [Rhizobium phage RHph_I1_6]QIG76532.1 hypothetical protein EVC27_007 [Rhizobium phage RHph_I1_6]